MESQDLLHKQGVILDLQAMSKKQVFEHLADRAAEMTGLHQRVLFDMLLERERLGSTGVGEGVAIPHARPDGITQIYGLFARLAKPIPFDAPDDEPVDLVFLLLAPASEGGDHLRALARVARMLRDKTIRGQLRQATLPQQVVDIVANVQHRAAGE
ncbi:MAG: PTS IIA-like nitrogen regulatory protein PtsN [Alphaproteobacteria bacterium]